MYNLTDTNSSKILACLFKDIELTFLLPNSYATSDGTSHNAEGHAINVGSENEGIAVKGSYTWVDDVGQSHTINYVADENGFQAQGADVPVGPEPIVGSHH